MSNTLLIAHSASNFVTHFVTFLMNLGMGLLGIMFFYLVIKTIDKYFTSGKFSLVFLWKDNKPSIIVSFLTVFFVELIYALEPTTVQNFLSMMGIAIADGNMGHINIAIILCVTIYEGRKRRTSMIENMTKNTRKQEIISDNVD